MQLHFGFLRYQLDLEYLFVREEVSITGCNSLYGFFNICGYSALNFS